MLNVEEDNEIRKKKDGEPEWNLNVLTLYMDRPFPKIKSMEPSM